MKKNKIGLFAFEIAVSLVLLCAPSVWAQQPLQAAQTGKLPKTAPHTPPPPDRSSTASASSGDSASADTDTAPEWMIYEFYFTHVTNLEEAADEEEKQMTEKKETADGSNVSPWRTHEQRTVGLTDDEAKTLREVALDCKSALKVQEQKMAVFRDEYRTQHPERLADPQPAPEYVQLWEERTQIIKDHIEQLKLSLGDSTFQKLDEYVKREFAPDIKKVTSPASTQGTVQ